MSPQTFNALRDRHDKNVNCVVAGDLKERIWLKTD